MIYTIRRRIELNEALFSRLEEERKNFITNGTYIYLKKLPRRAERAWSVTDIKNEIPYTHMVWDSVVPVFTPINYKGKECFSVGYVNRSETSVRMAAEKIESSIMYFIPGMKLEKGADYARV